jgi:class 3 adenylate cyclase
MKAGETRIAEHFSDVTVLFADVVGFTKLSSHVNPRELVELLDAVFTALDALAAKHGLEKIKTIGDAYMVVCGVPVPMEDHCERVARFAAEMQGVIDEVRSRWAVEGKELGTHAITMRVGIHIGEVIAGIIGSQKFTYDLWGDTVNTASRMESHGEPGKIHVSEEVFETLKEKFVFEERGEIEVKGKGAMRTWFLTDAKQTAPQAV